MTAQLSDAVRALILKLMDARQMSGSQLAQASGVPQTSISRKLREGGRFDFDDVAAIAPVFDLTAGELVTWAERSLRSEG